ncbi:MAG: ribulose-phosphate 3-epimerase [Proteobacteria bacterium]|nr:ribulose-phosphate 3-epimerase [Pseudomonadota bacterium]
MNPIIIAPSILAADFGRLAAEVEALERGGADYIHVDVMDGRFVPNLTIGPPVVAALRRATRLPLDVHLMIEDPDRLLTAFAAAGADVLTVHVEACTHLHRTLQTIHALGKRAGVALNPATPIETVRWVLDQVDQVLLMAVNPGFGGQSFIPATLARLVELKGLLAQQGLLARQGLLAQAGPGAKPGARTPDIEVDGGIDAENIAEVARAGANVLVAGTAILRTPDYGATVATLRRRAVEALSSRAGDGS